MLNGNTNNTTCFQWSSAVYEYYYTASIANTLTTTLEVAPLDCKHYISTNVGPLASAVGPRRACL